MATEAILKQIKTRLNLTQEEIDGVSFIYWLTCLCENLITNAISKALGKIATKGGHPRAEEMFEFMFVEMTFNSKIKALEKSIEINTPDDKRYDKLLKFFQQLNSIRNQIAHYKFSNLTWRDQDISKAEVQDSIVQEFVSATGWLSN